VQRHKKKGRETVFVCEIPLLAIEALQLRLNLSNGIPARIIWLAAIRWGGWPIYCKLLRAQGLKAFFELPANHDYFNAQLVK